jgi:peptide/nickel transport system permease protein
MTGKAEVELISKKETEEKITIKTILKWIKSNLKFLLIPGYRINDLMVREFEYEKTVSKRRFIRRLKYSLTLIGMIIIFLIVTMAIFPEWISPYSFEEVNFYMGNIWLPPSPDHPLGLSYGRDILARIIFGARSALIIAIPAILFSMTIGVVIGMIAAYYGRWIDSITMRLGDILLSFPGLMLAMIILSIWDRRMEYIILAYGVIGIPIYARLIRGSVLQARSLPYIEAARVAGAGNWRIMFKHILPNCIQPVIIAFTFDIGGIILSLAALSFLGYGDYRLIQWGTDISDARYHIIDTPWASLGPGVMILISVIGFMLLGDGLRDALDPRLKNL